MKMEVSQGCVLACLLDLLVALPLGETRRDLTALLMVQFNVNHGPTWLAYLHAFWPDTVICLSISQLLNVELLFKSRSS